MDPVTCGACGKRFPVDGLTTDQRRALEDEHYHDELAEELRMLEKVTAFYCRHPDAEGRIKPDFLRAMDSEDPAVQEQVWSGVPFNRIQLPPEELRSEWTADPNDAEVMEYLRHNSFVLDGRMQSVSEQIEQRKGSVGLVPCPDCQVGRLYVAAEHWDAFANAIYPAIAWYWPEWKGLDCDGTLHVKTSGFAGGCHWNGEQTFAPSDPDYAFWRWFVLQKQHHRLVAKTEIPAILDEWRRATNPGG
jgi:hypothetical protein